MNRLKLVQRLHSEAGVSGNPPQSTTNDLNSMTRRMVNWIDDAWLDLQGSADDWGFMFGEFTMPIAPPVGEYPPSAAGIDDFRYWITDSFRSYLTDVGRADDMWLVEWDYRVFMDTYRFGLQTPGRPMVFSIQPRTNALMFGPVPERPYTVYGEYRKKPKPFTTDTDEPTIPSHLHLILVWMALEKYGIFDAAPEVVTRAQIEYHRLYSQLCREELPVVSLGNPLA